MPGRIIYYDKEEKPIKTQQADLKSGFGFIESDCTSFLDTRFTTNLGENLYLHLIESSYNSEQKSLPNSTTEISKSIANLTPNLFKPSNSVRSFFNNDEGSMKIVLFL